MTVADGVFIGVLLLILLLAIFNFIVGILAWRVENKRHTELMNKIFGEQHEKRKTD